MGSNRKYKNGAWKDESHSQEAVSSALFQGFRTVLGDNFISQLVNFHHVTGDCTYTYNMKNGNEYIITVNRDGKIIQESRELK